MKCKCPLCDGSGRIEMELKPKKFESQKAAINMRKKGFTIRQIMRTLGYKNPGSVSHLLNKATLK